MLNLEQNWSRSADDHSELEFETCELEFVLSRDTRNAEDTYKLEFVIHVSGLKS